MRTKARTARWDRVRHQFQTTERAISAGIFMPSDDPKTCSWCGYRKRCQSNLVKDDYLASQIRASTTNPEAA